MRRSLSAYAKANPGNAELRRADRHRPAFPDGAVQDQERRPYRACALSRFRPDHHRCDRRADPADDGRQVRAAAAGAVGPAARDRGRRIETLAGTARRRHADRGRLSGCGLRHDLRDRGADGYARRRDRDAQRARSTRGCAPTRCARASASSASIRRSRTVAEFNALVAAEAPRWAEVVRVTGIKAGE